MHSDACLSVHTQRRTHTHVCVCTYTRMSAHTHAHTHKLMHVCAWCLRASLMITASLIHTEESLIPHTRGADRCVHRVVRSASIVQSARSPHDTPLYRGLLCPISPPPIHPKSIIRLQLHSLGWGGALPLPRKPACPTLKNPLSHRQSSSLIREGKRSQINPAVT